jgi:hypothetical protein
MFTATMNPAFLRYGSFEHRTEPRLVTQMAAADPGHAKLKPTVFLPSALMRHAQSLLTGGRGAAPSGARGKREG